MKKVLRMHSCLVLIAILVIGCKQENISSKASVNKNLGEDKEKGASSNKTELHVHGVGPNGGIVFELGKYHAEFTVDHDKKECTVLMLSSDEKNPQPIKVDAKELMLTTKETKTADGKLISRLTIKLLPKVDALAKGSSIFVGSDANLSNIVNFAGMVIGEIDGKPSQGEFKEEKEGHGHAGTQTATSNSSGREAALFLTPGGIYTAADIEKNGQVVPSVKFQGISWAHDDDLKKGDKVCPVTDNKADAQCTWYVNGKKYEFCCPPCLEKFVNWAKTQPDKVKPPEAYVK